MQPDHRLAETITQFVAQFYILPIADDVALTTLKDSLSQGQLNSKLRLVELCETHQIRAKSALILGHWHGMLPLLLKNFGIIESAHGIEQDQAWVEFSQSLNHQWSWTSEQADATTYVPRQETDLIINTSCEHMNDDWIQKIPIGMLAIAQSTDYTHSTHTNRTENLAEFKKRFENFELIAADEMCGNVYKRFTIIARRIK